MRKVDPAKIVRNLAKKEAEGWSGSITFRFQDGNIMNIRELRKLPIENPKSFRESEKEFLADLSEEAREQVRKHYAGLQGFRVWGKVSFAHGEITNMELDRSLSIEQFWESKR